MAPSISAWLHNSSAPHSAAHKNPHMLNANVLQNSSHCTHGCLLQRRQRADASIKIKKKRGRERTLPYGPYAAHAKVWARRVFNAVWRYWVPSVSACHPGWFQRCVSKICHGNLQEEHIQWMRERRQAPAQMCEDNYAHIITRRGSWILIIMKPIIHLANLQ